MCWFTKTLDMSRIHLYWTSFSENFALVSFNSDKFWIPYKFQTSEVEWEWPVEDRAMNLLCSMWLALTSDSHLRWAKRKLSAFECQIYLWLIGWQKEDHLKPTMQICFGIGLERHKMAWPRRNHTEDNFKSNKNGNYCPKNIPSPDLSEAKFWRKQS